MLAQVLPNADPNLHMTAQSLLLLIAFIGVMAMLVVMGLLISWRRYNDRLRKQQREQSADLQDTWRISADRMQPVEDDEEDDDDDDER